MVCIGKRLAAFLLAVFVAVSGVVYPVTAAAATYNAASNLTGRMWYVPAAGTWVAGAEVVATGASFLARANPWVAGITLGLPIMRWALEKNGGDRMQIIPRNAPFPTPSGWTEDDLGPKPPMVVEKGWTWGWSPCTVGVNCTDGVSYPSCESALAAGMATQKNSSLSGANPCPAGGGWCMKDTNNTVRCYGGVSGNNCPSGYSATINGCALSNRDSVKWPKDGIPSYSPSTDGTTWVQHPRDPDPIPATPTPSDITNPSQNYAPDPYGNPTSISFAPNSAGGFFIDQRVQTTNNNQTTTTINNITVNNVGAVTNITSTTVPGSLTTATPTATPTSPSTQFPTDYNRESTQQAIQQKLEDIKSGTGAADAPNYQTDTDAKKDAMKQAIKEQADAIPGQYSGDKGNWFSWVWTPPVGACSPWTNVIHGQTVTWDVCPYIAKVRDVIGYMLAVASALVVYSQLFRKED